MGVLKCAARSARKVGPIVNVYSINHLLKKCYRNCLAGIDKAKRAVMCQTLNVGFAYPFLFLSSSAVTICLKLMSKDPV